MKRRAAALTVSVLLVVLCVSACGRTSDDQPLVRSSLPTSPGSPPAQPRTTSGISVYGVVFDYTSQGAVPRAKVPVFVHSSASDTVFSVTSDSAGRYAVSGVPGTAIWVTPDIRSGYYAPCPSGWSGIRSDVEFDLHVIAATLLSTAGAPVNMPVNSSIWVSGVVYESTADGKRPVAGATVNLGRASPHPHSGTTTLTDSAGRYLMCPSIPSHGSDISVEVEVERDGYLPASKTAVLGWDWTGFDFQLVRK